jgi:glycosyltransferase involved in cell wall biosynthesis
MRTSIAIAKRVLRSPRAYLAAAGDVLARMAREQRQASGPPRPVSDDLPHVEFRNVTAIDAPPRLDVLLPSLQFRHLSGGPNTALNLTYRLAAAGLPVRFFSTDLPHDDEQALRRHCGELAGVAERLENVSFADLHDRTSPTAIGRRDVLFSTAWWTAHYARQMLARTQRHDFIYLIQDYEAGFHPWSCEHALALETYGMPMRAVICGRLLAEYVQEQAVGRFADPGFVDSCLVFEPAIDRRRFYADERRLGGRVEEQAAPGGRRLLFYARPDAPRNLFEIGLLALRRAVERGAFPADGWELWFIGGDVPPRNLGRGVVIRQHPWLDYDGYAALLRSCDVGLSLTLSPHTSYPPLEMAACGTSVVTNTFANKTAERLRAYSGNILPAAPVVDAISDGLLAAYERTDDADARRDGSAVAAPTSWDEAFADVVPRLVEEWRTG